MQSSAERMKVESDKKPLFFGEKGQFTQITNRLFSQGKYLSLHAKWVYTTLKSFWNFDSGRIFPSYQRIMERSGLTKPTISKALKELEYFGWIIIERHFKGDENKNRRTSDYHLCFPKINSPEQSGEILNDKEWYCCPTKQQAAEWKKVQAQKRSKSGKRRLEQKPWERGVEFNNFGDEDIPF